MFTACCRCLHTSHVSLSASTAASASHCPRHRMHRPNAESSCRLLRSPPFLSSPACSCCALSASALCMPRQNRHTRGCEQTSSPCYRWFGQRSFGLSASHLAFHADHTFRLDC